MGRLAQAILEDGTALPYVIRENPPRGGMKHTYFAPDGSYVVQFFNDPAMARDPNLARRLRAIIGRYNPTRPEKDGGAPGSDEKSAVYFSGLYCWPRAVVREPEFGIVSPAYPPIYRFGRGASYEYNLEGADKRCTWFTVPARRKYLVRAELGDFRTMLRVSINLARAVRRMHQAGLAHSDLSPNNVLADPVTGGCVVIDIDALVVPGIFPPEVIGTPGYIAPEVLDSLRLPPGHPARKSACIATDLHALAVLIYEFLLQRHPLAGPRFDAALASGDELSAFGTGAVFAEHPANTSNRPDMKWASRDLGPYLEQLFYRAFVEGLHSPDRRPAALEWERGLERTWELLQPCTNLACTHKWFVLHRTKRLRCPFCGSETIGRDMMRVTFWQRMRGRRGIWMPRGETNVYHNMPLYGWHLYGDLYPNERADTAELASIYEAGGKWYLANKGTAGMISASGTLIPEGDRVLLENGTFFCVAGAKNGLLGRVMLFKAGT